MTTHHEHGHHSSHHHAHKNHVAPPPPRPQSYTDVYGIVSIVLSVFLFTIPGFIVGIIGVKKAKKAHASTMMSHIGWILNVVAFFVSAIFIGAIWYVIAHAPDDQNWLSDTNDAAVEQTQKRVVSEHMALTVPKSFGENYADGIESDIELSDTENSLEVYAYFEPVADFAAGTALTDYANGSVESFKTNPDFTRQSAKKLTAGTVRNPRNYNVQDYYMEGVTENRRFIYTMRYVKTTSGFYTISTYTVPSDYAANKADMYNILGSFEVRG